MVDRYTITCNSNALKELSGKLEEIEAFDPCFNAAPSHLLPVTTVSDPNKVSLMQWGFISILSNNKKMSPKLFNTDLQQINSKTALRKSLQKNRCIIYADGFFFWKQIAKKALTPYYVFNSNRQPFCIGGFWEEKDEFVENSADSFMMLTRPIVPELEDYQEDMPFIIPADKIPQWMDPNLEIEKVLDWIDEKLPLSFSVHAVSPAINNPNINDPRLIKMSNPADQHGNYTLFG